GCCYRINVIERLYIGRVCQGVPADKRILIRDVNVSRDHAIITCAGNALTIKDSSRNGTWVNNVRITSGGEQKLSSGDVVHIGSTKLHVVFSEQSDHHHSGGVNQVETTRVLSREETVTHLVADIRGFSTLVQQTESSLLFEVLSQLYESLTNIVHENRGTVKDFAGDAIFAFWEHNDKNDLTVVQSACHAALLQKQAAIALFSNLPEKFSTLRHLKLGWGIATGPVTVSHYGVRSENLALVGDSTNLAFRLSGLANKELSSTIVICQKTAKMVEQLMRVTPLGEIGTKGRTGKEAVFSIT
ncbi:MAG: adenylate/guanylate cyclase domain-containing protein, partial [Gammaproteobacteria bacterium]|nr:adenylate/guanylate cyclase domain-containing protein [Gammaproteobacteria bacterium]